MLLASRLRTVVYYIYMKESYQAPPQPNRQEMFHGIHRELVNNAHAKAEKLLDREKVDPKTFTDIYTAEDIQKDLDHTEKLEKKFEESKKENELLHKVSLATEALFYEQIALSDWLSAPGVKVYVEKTSQVDDFINKTDMVLVFVTKEDEEPLSITVDVTLGILSLNEKIHSIKQEIDTKTLGHIKYHETLSGEHTSLEGVPRVLLGIEPEELTQLLKLWVQDSEAAKSRLRTHPVQLALVRQIEEQLLAYQKYAQSSHDEATAKKYETLVHIMQRVKKAKEEVHAQEEGENLFRFLGMMRRVLSSQLMFVGSQVPEGTTGQNKTGQSRANKLHGR